MVKCGAQPVFYAYPAWTFGGKRRGELAPPGPGVGEIGAKSTLGPTGPKWGPSRPSNNNQGEPYGETFIGHRAPGGPAYTFGDRHPEALNANPGPASYDVARSAMHSAPTSSWGPAPRALRPASAPRSWPLERQPPAKAKGPSFGLPYYKHQDLTPGPYGPCNTCTYCDTYNGVTMKSRKPTFYGKVSTITPGPAAYHTECSTIAVATVKCKSDDVCFRP